MGRRQAPPAPRGAGRTEERLPPDIGLVPAQLAPQALSDPHPEASNSPADKPPREGFSFLFFFFFCRQEGEEEALRGLFGVYWWKGAPALATELGSGRDGN